MCIRDRPEPVPDYTQFIGREIKGIRVGLPREYFERGIDPAVKDVTLKAAGVLEDLGCLLYTSRCV